MDHELVGLFGGIVWANVVVYLVYGIKGLFGDHAIDQVRTSAYQIINLAVLASILYDGKAHQVTVGMGIYNVYGVASSGPGSWINLHIALMMGKQAGYVRPVGHVD